MKTNQKTYFLGCTIVTLLLLMMIISFFYVPFNPNAMDTGARFAPPSLTHWFGTDNFGRDIFSRIMEGSKTAFFIGFAAIAISLTAGLFIGAIAGYFEGWLGELLMRLMDAMMSIPSILFLIMLVTIFGTGITNTIIALGVMRIPSFARMVRSGFIQIKQFDFVKASIVKGGGSFHIIFHHILPYLGSQLLVMTSLAISGTILSESGLSYLGLGVQPPNPSWGRMLKEAQPYLSQAPWYILSTGLMITLMVLGFNLLGDGIRGRLNDNE